MEYYKCSKCGEVFESYTYVSPLPFEQSHYPCCPKCGSYDVYEK